ncbi:radical SAM protein [Brevibacillus marinus]|uniref:radical SAM protein n=1 Tax=Brevibacillus marinus TaxID=2496837 RepID=UPI000F829669|nr:radical SAM protein [Brevibacillus marinus]
MQLVYADQRGRVYDHPDLFAVARNGDILTEILDEELIPLPEGATLVSLPDTIPVGMDPATGEMIRLEGCTAVGALLPQGFTRLLLPGYIKVDKQKKLPLFGYTAVVWKEEQFWVAARQSDDPHKWNPLLAPMDELGRLVEQTCSRFPNNRIFRHLAHCALEYECLTAANNFFHRWEGSLPVSYTCNAGCYGCISEQPEDSGFPAPQTRMNFRPTEDELVEVMLHHLQTPESIISFGQGCEGEPATMAALIVPAIRRVRQQTAMGYININTNAGLTDHIKAIVDAGLDLMRISIISAIEDHYNAYYRPRAYTLEHVARSAAYASANGVYTSINYLCFPGVFDREEEIEAMISFIRRTGIKLIQLRNLNVDPDSYLALIPKARGEVFGMKQAIEIYRQELPDVVIGSYTHVPPETMRRTAKVRGND